VVSPATWTWERETLGKDLRTLLTERRLWSREVAVAGLPCINSSRVFNWPLRRVRYGYWKLAYEEYATGHETSPYLPLTQFWAVGDTTSGTRAYSSQVFAQLQDQLA
ncbi:unnamed protein product, partial [Polarella glacialis]